MNQMITSWDQVANNKHLHRLLTSKTPRNGKVDSSGAMKPDVGSDENKTTGEIGNHNAPDSTMTNGEPHSEKPNIEAPLEKPAEAKFVLLRLEMTGRRII